MASKISNLAGTKELVRGMINGISQQMQILEDFIDECKQQVLKDGKDLLQEKSRTRFFQKFPLVSQRLGESLSQLSLVTEAIDSLDEEATQSGSDEEEPSAKSRVEVRSVSTMTETMSFEEERALRNELFSDEKTKNTETSSAEEKSAGRDLVLAAGIKSSREKNQNSSQIDLLQKNLSNKNVLKAERIRSRTQSNSSKAGKKIFAEKPGRKSSSKSSVAPLLPRVLLDDVTVPLAVVKFNVCQTAIVSEIENPWSFYIQVHEPAYNQLMEELCLFFSREASQGYKGGISNIPNIGSYCCAKSPFDQTWYRAQIKVVDTLEALDIQGATSDSSTSCHDDPVLSNILITVFMIDEGMTAKVRIGSIRRLDKRFAELPVQAIHCYLGGAAPLKYDLNSVDLSWSEMSIDWFNCTIKSEQLFTCFIHEYPMKNECVSIDLYTGEHTCNNDTLPSIDDNVAYMMLLVGMASPYPLTQSHVKDHYQKIDAIGYKPYDHPMNDEGTEDASNTKEEIVKAPRVSTEIETRQLKNKTERPFGVVNGVSERLVKTEKIHMSIDEARSVGKTPMLNATFENRFVEKDFNIGAEGFCQVIVSNVTDPGLFHVHLITPDVGMLDSMTNALNKCYSNNDFPIPDHRLSIGDAVIVKFSLDECWYRGVIQNMRIPLVEDSPNDESRTYVNETKYEVFHIDFGSYEWVNHSKVRPVIDEFFELPMETLPCTLADVEPMEISRDASAVHSSNSAGNESRRSFSLEINCEVIEPRFKRAPNATLDTDVGDEDIDDEIQSTNNHSTGRSGRVTWSSASIERFKELTLDGGQRIVSLKDGGVKKNMMDGPTPVYLYDTNCEVAILINEILVNEAFASSNVYTKRAETKQSAQDSETELANTNEEEAKQDGQTNVDEPQSPSTPTATQMDEWDPMKEGFLSNRNAYSVDPDDPNTAITGYAEPTRRVCRFFATRHGCRRGAQCSYAHSRPGDSSLGKMETFGYTDATEQFPELPEYGSIVLAQITSIITPVHFYVRFPYGTRNFEEILKGSSLTQEFDDRDELMDLQDDLNRKYSSMPYRDSEMMTFQEGDLVVARFPEDRKWYRARVFHVLEGEYSVCYIDFGNEAKVQVKDIRQLLPSFMVLRPQAVEVFLANVELDGSLMKDDNLRLQSTEYFKQLVGDCVVVARIMSVSSNGSLGVELYDKQTSKNINTLLLTKEYFLRTSEKVTRPWNMQEAMKSNAEIKYFTPG